MFHKISLLLALGFFLSFSAFSQNTNQVPNTQPDTNKINKNKVIEPDTRGGSQVNPTKNKELAPGESIAPYEKENKMELEESPQKSEPVPGAEILIEQSTNDVNYKAPATETPKEEKDKKKKKEKD